MDDEEEKEKNLRHLPKGRTQSIRQMFEGTENPNRHSAPSKPLISTPIPANQRPASTLFSSGNEQENRQIPPNIKRSKPFLPPRPKSELTGLAVAKALQKLNKDTQKPVDINANQKVLKSRDESPLARTENDAERKGLKPLLPNKPIVIKDQITITVPKFSNAINENGQETICHVSKHAKTDRPVSVLQRTKLFENVDNAQERTESVSIVRPIPTTRKKLPLESVPKPSNRDQNVNDVENQYCEPWDGKLRVSVQPKVLKLPISPPPKKPPRTGAHSDYMQTKLLQKKLHQIPVKNQSGDVQEHLYDKVADEENYAENEPVYKRIKKIESTPSMSPEKRRSSVDVDKPKPEKPHRPPPPRPRPASISSISSDECSDHRFIRSAYGTLPRNNKFNKEKKLKPHDLDLSQIKHWDLPDDKHLHRSPMRRSLSAECIANDISGDPVYIDPVKVVSFRDDTGPTTPRYEVYVDTSGYAVPYRQKLKLDQTRSWDTNDSLSSSRPLGDAVRSKLDGWKKKLFSPDSTSTKPKMETQTDTPQIRRKKLQTVKQRISLAFAVLQAWKKEDIKDDDVTSEPSTSTDEDSLVDVKEINKRKDYCSLVRQRTFKSIKKTRDVQQQIYPQLFDYALIVTLQPKDGTTSYEPKIIYKFPDHLEPNISVPQFCFPDASEFDVKSASPAAKSESYSFVLTSGDGERVYGYCRRFVPFRTPAGLPEVVCIISPVNAFSMYNHLLDEIENHRQVNLETAQELIAAAFGRPLPNPGSVVHVRTLDEAGEMGTIFLKRALDSRVDNVNCECLLKLGYDKLMKIFSCILLERSVLFCAKNLSTLSQTIHAFSSLLYPFHWQHTYIPVLPENMIDIVCSPTPYLIGVLTSQLPQVDTLPVEQVVFIDLDKKQLLRSQGDEGTLLPKKLQKAIKTVLNLCKIDSAVKGMQNLMISEAFLRLFVEVAGHYGEHIITQQDGHKIFQKETFIANGLSESVQQFLEWFTETQMFEVFMTDQLESRNHDKTLELFNSRVMEYRSESMTTKDFKRGQKMKCLKKLLKTS